MSTVVPITPEIAAHVLAHFGHGGYEAGTFTRHLLSAMDTADPANLALLGKAFPGYAAAIVGIKYDPDGVEALRRMASIGLTCITCDSTSGPFISSYSHTLCETCHQRQQ
ncbi:hypothetical protein ACH4OH_28250 [Streptomyces albidoflavus]